MNEALVLVTITESSGSSPRHSGSRMLVGKGKSADPERLWGSIGGGITEHLALKEAIGILQNGESFSGALLKKYSLRSDEAASEGAVCGGEITVSFRLLASKDEKTLKEIEKEMLSRGIVYVFGGGHVAQELVSLLYRLDFRCVVFDDREEFVSKDLFPCAEKLILGDFSNINKSIALTKDDYAVIVTRGHLWDLEAWAFALKSGAAYIGIIGSKSKHEFVKGKLRELGFAADAINAERVHAPIGIEIKSETPAEIAVSIAAEVILWRAHLKA